MSTPEAPRPGGSHRAAPPPGPPSGGSPLLLPLLSALVVLGAIGLAAWMLLTSGDESDDADSPSVTQPTTQPTGASPTGSGEPSGEPSDKPSDGGSPNPSDSGDGDKGDGNKGDKGDGDNGNNNGGKNDGDGNNGGNDGQKSDAPIPQVPIYVFNQTGITGLAATTASGLEADGWNVVGVDNWIGTVPEDTVYFYPGDRQKAEHLARELRISRVWPASAPMPSGALTVILATTERK